MKKKIMIFIFSLMIILISAEPMRASAGEVSIQRNSAIAYYRVVRGDTLTRIALKYNTSVYRIKTLNRLRSNYLYVGQTLKVPSRANVSTLYYTVRPGETLWSISRRTGVSVYTIKAVNGMKSNYLYAGRILKITYRNSPATVNYKVASGETPWSLSRKYNTSTTAIIRSNYMKVNYFMPGQVVTVPLNSRQYVRPIGIKMLRAKANLRYGDIYTWNNARRLFTVGTTAMVKDVRTGATWNIKYYGGSSHADIVTLTKTDTAKMYRTFGYRWSWSKKRPVIIYFTKGGIRYQIAASLTGMPHSTTNIYTNNMRGHCDLYFYNSIGHSNPNIDPAAQYNVRRANGQ